MQLAELIENTSKDKEKVKKMSKTNAKSLNAMKQNIKKNNIQYEDDIKKYLEVSHIFLFRSFDGWIALKLATAADPGT